MLYWFFGVLSRVPGVLSLALWYEERSRQRAAKRRREKRQ